ncbi:transcriptional regulator NanR [Devosia algicola]|uniref:Transcriptional regulator NanR n=1 Tax=Devosia algicola TaxID=3026418 RepID=A0ABY7YJE7_9HYPH|nr:transcriptional regulator NanR [Devosia algicola]WDR01303.1 transcriptional regulator NanR [Devosia algicola]
MSIDKPIARVKLSDQVQSRLLSFIHAEKLRPGDPLPSERELMETYSVGRPAIREAMQNLKRMGLIEIKHGERPRIAEPSFDRMVDQMSETMRHLLIHSSTSLSHLKEARATFEMEVGRIAARKRTPADIEDLEAILARQDSVRLNAPAFLKADGDFHHRIALISGNPIFSSLSQSLFGWLAQFHFDLVRKPGLERITLDEHWQIVEAIKKGDPEETARVTEAHLNRANRLYHQDNYSQAN